MRTGPGRTVLSTQYWVLGMSARRPRPRMSSVSAPPRSPTPPAAAAPPAAGTPLPPRKLDPLAAVLSYLLPGLGQVMQGRVGKGVLFFVCLYGLFFYGLWMGQMKNVWLPDAKELPEASLPILGKLDGMPKALYY